MQTDSPGFLLRQAIQKEKPLQIAGVINAYCAVMATTVGFQALYLSGAGVANACFALPDLGMTSLDNVAEEVRRITSATSLPLLVDADTGWGHALNVAHTIQVLEKAGAAGVHIEDQAFAKRCGHREGKRLVETTEMCERIQAAVQAKKDKSFVIMARTDAASVAGVPEAIQRAQAYVAAGADMIFAEAVTSLSDYKQFVSALSVPVLANMTEFGKTPLFTIEALREVGVSMVLYPLSAFRAMNQAALQVYQTLRQTGTQQSVLPQMQTREALYQFLNYAQFEKQLDQSS